MERITLRLPDDLYQQVKDRATDEQRSLNAQIAHDLRRVPELEAEIIRLRRLIEAGRADSRS